MTKLFIKISIFIIPFILILNLPKYTNYIFKTEIKEKINTFYKDTEEPIIIVGGDSRAERQVIPKIMEDRLDVKTINIGVSAGDIVILYNALKEYNLVESKNTLIISASSWQTNNNTVDKWGIPHANLTHMSTIEQIRLFGKRYLNVMHERFRKILGELFKIDSQNTMFIEDERISTIGFYGIEGITSKAIIDTIDIYGDTLKLDWYIGAENNGVRKDIFVEIMEKIADLGMNTIIYQSPFAPSWRERTKGIYIDSIEVDHSLLMRDISNKYDNVSFIDFYTDQDLIYKDSMFYNTAHFNVNGAKVFTNTLVDSLINRKLLIYN